MQLTMDIEVIQLKPTHKKVTCIEVIQLKPTQ